MPWVYLLRCADGSLRGGAARDLAARLGALERGGAAGDTRARRPVELRWAQEVESWSEALGEEQRVEALAPPQKETLAATGAVGLAHLTRASYREMPWKNGRGTTTEIARRPAGEGPFDWRVSSARVEAAGPFSPFPGIDRVIVALDGDGLRLAHDDQGTSATLAPLQPYAFSGDWRTTGAPRGGPVRDFNVLWRRDCFRATVTVSGAGARTVRLGHATLLHLVAGEAAVIVPGGRAELAAGETALAELGPGAPRSAGVLRAGPGAVLLQVELQPCTERGSGSRDRAAAIIKE